MSLLTDEQLDALRQIKVIEVLKNHDFQGVVIKEQDPWSHDMNIWYCNLYTVCNQILLYVVEFQDKTVNVTSTDYEIMT
jgi:hypothetical protein